MTLDKFMHILFRILKWTFGTLVISVVIIFVLGHYYKTFDFDIVDGFGPHNGYSQTKEEAIERHTFICDVKLPSQPYRISSTKSIHLKRGWIEQSWTGGFWYWTTHIDKDDLYYNLVLECNKDNKDKTDWTIINNKYGGRGYESLQDNMSYLGTITGELDSLPMKDTLRYNVLKRDTIDFHPSNLDGTLVLVLYNYAALN